MPNAKDVFDTLVPAGLAANPDKGNEIGACYFFKVSGENGGEWTVDLASKPPTCTKGAGATPQCSIEIADTDFEAMMANPQLGMQLYFQGKLKVTGDPMLATKLQKLFQLGQ